MALTKLNTDYVFGGGYELDRDTFLKLAENPDLFRDGHNTKIHSSGDAALPTIGYGYDLTQRSIDEIEAFLPDVIGTLTAQQQNAMTLLGLWRRGATVTFTLNGTDTSRELHRADITGGAGGGAGTVTYVKDGISHTVDLSDLSTLELDDAQATTLLHYVLRQNAGPNYAGKNKHDFFEDEVGDSLGLAESRERAALVSLIYVGGPDIVGAHTQAALSADQRAEAWYEIRYNDNNGCRTALKSLNPRTSYELAPASYVFGA